MKLSQTARLTPWSFFETFLNSKTNPLSHLKLSQTARLTLVLFWNSPAVRLTPSSHLKLPQMARLTPYPIWNIFQTARLIPCWKCIDISKDGRGLEIWVKLGPNGTNTNSNNVCGHQMGAFMTIHHQFISQYRTQLHIYSSLMITSFTWTTIQQNITKKLPLKAVKLNAQVYMKSRQEKIHINI